MTPQTLFYIIIAILTIDFIIDHIVDYLNFRHYNDPVPAELSDVYKEDEYQKSQNYKKDNYKFSLISGTFSFMLTLAFFFFKGFARVDELARSFTDNEIITGLIFFGIIMLANEIISIPFSYYSAFVIEEKYGFNKMSKKLFFTDKIKGLLLSAIIGGVILALIILFYQQTGDHFWIYTWILITIFTVFFTLFYSTLIVPLFNKQTPLEKGELRSGIEAFAEKVGFKLDNIYVIDGSKRSTKANAYFSGFGPKKRIVLYDTLISDLDHKEIIGVLAHEIGHYKKKHVLINMVISILITGLTLYILSIFIRNPLFSEALSVNIPSFHVGLITFGILYNPVSDITGIIMNYISRKFEYQADHFAGSSYDKDALITALKKLSGKSLSNLTPHKATVFIHYSHPTLLNRVKNLLTN